MISLFFLDKICTLFLQATQKQQGFNSLYHAVLCQIHNVRKDYMAEHFHRQIAINLCTQAKEISKMEYIKEKPKYHGYNYGVYCKEMAQENGIIPHIDLSAAAVQLFLNIPILVVKTSFTHNPTTNKKEWFCVAQEALGPSKLDIHKYKIIIVDNNDGFVGATTPIPITHLKEDQISLLDNLKYAVEATNTVLESVPQGAQFYKSTSRILNYSTAAHELTSSTDATTGTASVTLLQPMAPVPPMYLGIPAKKRKCTVSHTVTSADTDADTLAPTQMDPDVKFADQVPSPVASCKLHVLADFESAAVADF